MMIVVIRASKGERDTQKTRKKGNKLSKSKEKVKEHRLTIDVHHCLTSKTDKTLND